MKLNGADILIKALSQNGVKLVFGYPGASILSVYDSLYRNRQIKSALAASEQGAIFAAEGYARSSGEVGVCLATSGPGATNLITGIADAFMDSVPLVVVTGNVPLSKLGHDSFQEVDTSGIATPITKYSYIVKDVSDLAYTVFEAFALANSGRKGPVLIDIPENIFYDCCDYVAPSVISIKPLKQDLSGLEKVVKLINNSYSPAIYAGGGVIQADASNLLIKLSEKINAPVALSLMGLGGFPTSHKNCLGAAVSGNPLPSAALAQTDLLITLGARFASKATDHNLSYKKSLKMVHIDLDMSEIDKNLDADAYLAGDLKQILNLLIDRLDAKPDNGFASSLKAQAVINQSYPFQILEKLGAKLPDDVIVVSDVGQHLMWTALGLRFEKPRSFLASGGLGAMSFGLGAAIGAATATGKRVLLISGDGGFLMNSAELSTAITLKLPITALIFNNNTLGMIRQAQRKKYGKRYIASSLDRHTDFLALAKAYGADGLEVDLDNIDAALDKAYKSLKPTVLNCVIALDETGEKPFKE